MFGRYWCSDWNAYPTLNLQLPPPPQSLTVSIMSWCVPKAVLLILLLLLVPGLFPVLWPHVSFALLYLCVWLCVSMGVAAHPVHTWWFSFYQQTIHYSSAWLTTPRGFAKATPAVATCRSPAPCSSQPGPWPSSRTQLIHVWSEKCRTTRRPRSGAKTHQETEQGHQNRVLPWNMSVCLFVNRDRPYKAVVDAQKVFF